MQGASERGEGGGDWLDRIGDAALRIWHWPRRGARRKPLIVLVSAVALIVATAVIVADHWWRDELPRSTIAAVALGLIVIVSVWVFGGAGSKAALGVIATISAILVAAGSALDLDKRLPQGTPPVGALVDCPDFPSGKFQDGYTAETDLGYVHVREQPNLTSTVLRKYPAGCHLAFNGYCVGDPKADWRFHTLDTGWFKLADEPGYVASADTRARPGIGAFPIGHCDGGDPPPRKPEITSPTSSRLRGEVDITAAAPGAIAVGFAAYYPAVPGRAATAHWHQIDVDLDTGDGVSQVWDSRSVPGQSGPSPASVTLLAVPCLGLEFPYTRYAARTYVDANRGGPAPRPIRPPKRSFNVAGEKACANVER